MVDWTQGSKGLNYLQAAANARVVGAQVATMIRTLGVDLGRVHLIGHSLGAHVAGYAGEKFQTNGTIGRITGECVKGTLQASNFDTGKEIGRITGKCV